MRKQGFTLVELLAVIVILAVILAVAVPSISNMINTVKLEAYTKDEQMMVKAAKNYIATDESNLPINTGDTKELKLSDLQTNNFISPIKDPNNNSVTCDGYVLITKTTNKEYDYTPNLRCGDGLIANGYINDGLVGYWKLDGNAYDYSPNNRHGTIYGAIPGANRFGTTGKALSFDGVDDYVNLNYGVGLNPATNPHSFVMWIKNNTPSAATMFMSSSQAPLADNRFYLGGNNSKWDMGIKTSGWGGGTVSTNTNWAHVAVVLNGSTAILYINGVMSRTISYTSYSFNRNIYIANHDNNYYFNGLMDDVRIYSRALSETEVIHMYNVEK